VRACVSACVRACVRACVHEQRRAGRGVDAGDLPFGTSETLTGNARASLSKQRERDPTSLFGSGGCWTTRARHSRGKREAKGRGGGGAEWRALGGGSEIVGAFELVGMKGRPTQARLATERLRAATLSLVRRNPVQIYVQLLCQQCLKSPLVLVPRS